MEIPITLDELEQAAKNLVKNKMLGRDDMPIEIFLAMWKDIGPLFIAVLQQGLVDGSLHPQLTKGLILLLEKKGDQLLITNK